jgi:ribonuclease P protein component
MLRAMKTTLPLASKFGFSVSKKMFKHAVDRNTVRRRGYAAIEHLEKAANPSYKGLFILNRVERLPTVAEFESDIAKLLFDARILKIEKSR